MAAAFAVVSIVGCSSGNKSNPAPTGDAGQPKETAAPKETPYVEVWGNTNGALQVTKDSKVSQWLVKETGVGLIAPSLPWDGGTAYFQRLTTKISSGSLPDMFLPWNGNEGELIKQGVLVDLSEYLPKYAPNIWNGIPKNLWNVVRTADPEGKGRIFYIPLVQLYNDYGAFIRKDWLDRVGLGVPTTQDELVTVLKAFRDKDANGNGNPNDEIPISGREFGRWMDYLFAIYGVAMWEGLPMWDVYGGKLTYSAVTPNMKASLEFIRMLYQEKLLDNETFLNKSDSWMAKITSDRVGVFYHLNNSVNSRIAAIAKANKDVNLVALPPVKVNGYEGFITQPGINRPQWVFSKKSPEVTIGALKLVDWFTDPKQAAARSMGVEGMHWEMRNGKLFKFPLDTAKQELIPLGSVAMTYEERNATNEIIKSTVPEEELFAYKQRDSILVENQKYGKIIAGDGMPANIYDGFPDIKAHKLYQEYMTKIIIGEWPLEKFDEFVEKWNKTGGEEVTKRARVWYDQVLSFK